MKILFACNLKIDFKLWTDILHQHLPNAEVIVWNPDLQPTNAEYAIVWEPSPELFNKETNLKYLFNLGAGVDGIFKTPNLPKDINIVRLEDAGMGVQMAEYALHCVMQVARGFEFYRGKQQEKTWKKFPIIKREQWPVGILGAGLMGGRVAQLFASLDYPVALWSRSGSNFENTQSFKGADEFDAFLNRTRVLINLLPLTESTKGILNLENFKKLMPDPYVINIGRGPHLNENDLIHALDNDVLSGAFLDVFSTEPLPSDHAFWEHPKITITPHVAAVSLPNETVSQIAKKIKQLSQGESITGIVSHTTGY